MKVTRPLRAASSAAFVRFPKAVGRGVARTLRSRILPWLLVVAALVVAGYFWQQRHESQAEERRGQVVTAVARSFLGALTNFSASTIDTDVQRIRSFAVGDFADQVDEFFGPEAISKIKDAEAKSVGRVQSVFVQELSGATATVFGVVTEVVTNNSTPAPQTEIVRLNVQMIQTATGWKISKVEILQSPGSSPIGG
jgi:hypothetical protein